MKFRSVVSQHADPYRAGVEIAMALADMRPEVIFLFSSIDYGMNSELPEAIIAELNGCEPIVVGMTGDGIYTDNGVCDAGVSALAIRSDGKVHWHIARRNGVGLEPRRVAQECIDELMAACHGKPKFLFLASDFRTDTSGIVQSLVRATGIPLIGGLAADGYEFQKCRIYSGNEAQEDSLVMLAAEGNIACALRIGNSPLPVGKPAAISSAEGTLVHTIDGITARSFMEREIGKPLDHVDKGILTMKTLHPDYTGEHQIRSMLLADDDESQSVRLFGGVSEGELIQLCSYPPYRMEEDLNHIAASLKDLPFTPAAALIISCAGRKAILQERIAMEPNKLQAGVETPLALAGIPAFGEFAPVVRGRGFSPTLFHNMTFITLLLGEE